MAAAPTRPVPPATDRGAPAMPHGALGSPPEGALDAEQLAAIHRIEA